ncbi:MAG: DUF4157 domain-containing protein [Nitrospira sp.]
MGDTSTTKVAEPTRVKQKTEDRPRHEHEYAPRGYVDAVLFRSAAGDTSNTSPGNLSRVVRRLSSSHRTDLLLNAQRHYGNAHVQRMVARLEGDQAQPDPSEQSVGIASVEEPPTSTESLIPPGNGMPLPPHHRVAFEQALDHPLDHVRIHTGAQEHQAARRIQAEAFTAGSDIYFANGVYAPGTTSGDRVLAHELTHVVQNDEGRVPHISSREATISEPTDPLEREAYAQEEPVARQVTTHHTDNSFALDRSSLSSPPFADSIEKRRAPEPPTKPHNKQGSGEPGSATTSPLSALSPLATDSTPVSPSSRQAPVPGSSGRQATSPRTPPPLSNTTATGVAAPPSQSSHPASGSTVKGPASAIQAAARDAEQAQELPTPGFVPARPSTRQPVPVAPPGRATLPPSAAKLKPSGKPGTSMLSSPPVLPESASATYSHAPATDSKAATLPAMPAGAAPSLPATTISSAERAKATELPAPSGMVLPASTVPVPGARSTGAQLILDEIASATSASRQLVADRFNQGLQTIATNVREQQQMLLRTGEGQAEAVRGIFANAREQTIQVIAEAQSQIQTDAAAQQEMLDQGHAESLAKAETTFGSHQEHAQELGNTYSDRALDTADEAAQHVRSKIQGYAQEAEHIGQTKAGSGGGTSEIAETKAHVADELATDTASKITAGMSDAMTQLSSTGPPTADAIREQGQEAALQLGAGQAQVVDQLVSTNQQATSTIQQTTVAGNQAIGGLETQLLEQLLTLENTILTRLQAQIAQKNLEIDTAGQQAIAAFQEQGEQAVAAGDSNLAELNQQIAEMNISQTTAPDAARDIVGQINPAYESLVTTVDNSFQQVVDILSQTGADLVGAIDATSGSVNDQVSGFLTQAQSQIGQQGTAIGAQIANTVTHTTTAQSSLVDQITSSLDEQLTQLDQGFAQGLTDYQNHLNEQVTSAADQAREPATTLPTRIDQAQSRAETRAQQGFWERQWNDFKEMVSDPGFWAGLIVGLVLAVIVIALIVAGTLTGGLAIVAAFAVVGAIAAAVGSVVSQATNGSFSGGWEWSRVSGWEVLKAAAIGAVFGGVLAGAAVLMGPALAMSLTGIAIISGLTGVLTVITNLATGQPWDKGLVANMLLAGLLARLGKYIRLPGRGRTGGGRGGVPPEGEVPPEPARTEPVPEGEVPPEPARTEPVPEGEAPPEPARTEPVPESEAPPEPARTEPARTEERPPEVRPGEQNPEAGLQMEMRFQALRDAFRELTSTIENLKRGTFRSAEVGRLRADPATRRDLARWESELDAIERERISLQTEVDETLDAARDPELADLASEDAARLRQRLNELQQDADRINGNIEERLRAHAEEVAAREAARREAQRTVDRQVERVHNACDDTDGTARPGESVGGDPTTESILREEIRQGRPIFSNEGHYMKASQYSRALREAIQLLMEARPLIDDPARLQAIDDAIARGTERASRLEEGFRDWQNRAATHPDVWNPDGTSRVTPNWPTHPTYP